MKRGPDKVTIIVEETVQRVYQFDPDDPKTVETIELLGALMREPPAGRNMSSPRAPTVLGARARKGGRKAQFMEQFAADATWVRTTGFTYIIPDEMGRPSVETKYTTSSITRKPVKK